MLPNGLLLFLEPCLLILSQLEFTQQTVKKSVNTSLMILIAKLLSLKI